MSLVLVVKTHKYILHSSNYNIDVVYHTNELSFKFNCPYSAQTEQERGTRNELFSLVALKVRGMSKQAARF